jgi:hypothetical protein
MPSLISRRPPLPKASPQTDPRFAKIMEQLKRGAAKIRHHDPASRKAAEASAAAKGPPRERLAAGKAHQVNKIEEAPTKKPESSSFLAVLQAEIAKAMPKTLADTEKFMKGGSSEQLKGSLKGNVSQQKEQAEGGVKTASKETPKETGQAKTDTPIPPEAAPAAPPVNAAEGMPAPKTDADISLQDSKQDTEQQMKDADVTAPQLKKANDPRFSAVLTAKDEVAKQADAAPAQYRGQEKQVLSASAAGAKAVNAKGTAAMAHVRGGSNSAVLSRQAAAKARDEAKRKEVVDHIEEIYNRTKTNVENKLSTLETEVGAMFDAGTDAALSDMTAYVEKRIDEYKDDRYSGIVGKGRWIRDQFKGLPEEANRFYEDGRARFTKTMNTLVVRVAAIVEQRLKEAKDEVARGQAEIKSYVDSQPKELQAVAKKAQAEVSDRFKDLERGIDDKKQQLAESLAQKYKEGFDKANEALKKIQDANKGLIAGFIEKLKAVIEAIIEFKNKLMGVLRKGAAAIKLILADPIGFLSNLLDAIKQGFSQFASNIWTHLKAGFMKWMFGALAETGIEIPTDLSLPSILKLVLGVLGITYERMRAKAVKLVGERAVKFIEKLAEYIKVLFTGGWAALWEKVKEDLGNLKEMVIDAIQDWLITTIIKKAVAKIATMFNPVGAIIQAILAIVDVVIFVVEKANQILEFISAVVESISAIAQGQIAAAANWIERSLANMIPLLIGFLAQLLGLGGISKKIKDFITKIQDKVDKAIDKAIAKVVAVVKKLIGGGKEEKDGTEKDPEKLAKVSAGLKVLHEKEHASNSVKKDGKITKEDADQVAAQTKLAHPVFKSIRVVDGGDKWNYEYEASPGQVEPGLSKEEAIELGNAKREFGKGYFDREELEGILGLGKTAALDRISKWKSASLVFVYASAPSDVGTQYTFDKAAAGYRPTEPNNREKYGYKNPAKTSPVGLKILSKKFNPKTPEPIKRDEPDYHTQDALYDSARPGSSYKKFRFPVAILGHKEKMGASDHWNLHGHKQTKADNQAWNNDPKNYQGPEHEKESAASGGSSARYEAPARKRGSNKSWLT